jgi:hypothetical protein
VFIAAAAFWHFAWSGKSRKVVFTATPPATEPAKTKVVTISVHIIRLKSALPTRQDRNHNPDDPKGDNFKLAGRRHSVVLVTVLS